MFSYNNLIFQVYFKKSERTNVITGFGNTVEKCVKKKSCVGANWLNLLVAVEPA